MKKFNANWILFVFAIVFIVLGIWGNCFTKLKGAAIDLLAGVKHLDPEAVTGAKNLIDNASSKELRYHDLLMDADSVRNNVLGTRVITKDDTTIVKAYSGSLCDPSRRLTDSEIDEVVSCIQALKIVSEENGAEFLYCAAPKKEFYEQMPGNVSRYNRENFERLLAKLGSSQIPVLDFSETFRENGMTEASDIYYYTDHHWRIYAGFTASAAISRELSERYGFEYNEQYTDIHNYNVTTYPNWFLGSQGKKVGRFFTWHGADDFDLITPDFETDLTEEQPIKQEIREGTFEETVLFMQNMQKDFYHKNPYATYSGGDFRLQIMKNNLNTGGKKVLLVRDSYACAVAPFLALQCSELHVCDMRNYTYYVGDKLNLKDYINEIKPDYVIVLYASVNSVAGSNGRYDFF